MNNATTYLDFRNFRPTAVFIIDLVKHSKRPKSQVHTIQSLLISIFQETHERLNLIDLCFNFTGDGYVVAFPGDSSSRVFDFINAAMPLLMRRLKQHDQRFRAGLDFGLVHMSLNPLTGSQEHFDQPGIHAARLESCAQEGQILCSETVFQLFHHHYPNMFSEAPITVTAKDRQIDAYVVQPEDFSDIRQYFEDFIFQKTPDYQSLTSDRKRVLFVEDDPGLIDNYPLFFDPEMLQNITVVTATTGEEAMRQFEPKQYAFVVTDNIMPGMTGLELTERLIELDSELPVVMVTGHYSLSLEKRFYAVGGFYFFTKPFDLDEFQQALRRCITVNMTGKVRQELAILSDDLGGFQSTLQKVSEKFNNILKRTRQSDDHAGSLLRHKSKEVIKTFLDAVLPGNNVAALLNDVEVQLKCVDRLLRAVANVHLGTLEKHLKEYSNDMMKLNAKVRISNSFDPKELPTSLPNAGLLAIVVCELIDNSIAAIKSSGDISVRVSLLSSTRQLQVNVQDEGPGVSNEIRDSMFETGVSTKGHGRGLGLCLVKEAVSALKGDIKYEFDQGAVFSIIVPLQQPKM